MAADFTDRWLKVISGENRSGAASLQRAGLFVLSQFYRIGSGLRNTLFDLGIRRPVSVDVPVISLGNVTVGGTGKTPMVAWCVQQLQAMGLRPGILSRGYNALEDDSGRPVANDEKLLLDRLCPGVPHVQHRKRKIAADLLLANHDVDVIVLDDAFQHRQFHRDLDIVLVDATNPFGFKQLLPRGLLREPVRNLKRAECIVLTRADQASDLEQIIHVLQQFSSVEQVIPTVAFRCHSLINTGGDFCIPGDLNKQRIGAFCGIGNPTGFRKTLAELDFCLSDDAFKTYPDHHHYTEEDTHHLATWAKEMGLTAILTTQKDLVKIPQMHLGDTPLWSVAVEADFLSGQELLTSAIQRSVRQNDSTPF